MAKKKKKKEKITYDCLNCPGILLLLLADTGQQAVAEALGQVFRHLREEGPKSSSRSLALKTR